MGSCVSVHKNADSVMKIRLSIGSKTKKDVIPLHIKEKSINGEYPVSVFGFKSQSSPTSPFTNFGSKEETFFDSQAWLESDCEDDFLSVNGDFTPSRGNTPNYQNSFIGTPQLNKAHFMNRTPSLKPEPSPTDKKKRLSELFQESFAGEVSDDQNVDKEKLEAESTKLDSKSTNETPYVSGVNSVCSSERTPNKEFKPEKEKLSRGVQCCLPSFVPSRRSSEKKMLSPRRNGGG